jgi:hypothetical protein
MAAAAHVTAGIYGTFAGQPPFGATLGSPATISFWGTPVQMSLPTTGTVFHQVNPGIQVGNTSNYIYSVIEVQATGLNVNSTKYASNVALATLATNAG